MLKVNELFCSVQGEGCFVGTPSIFLRLSGCNLNCEWCDTEHEKHYLISVENLTEKIVKLVKQENIHQLVVTGGEPFLQAEELYNLLDRLNENPYTKRIKVQFETNGLFLDKIDTRYHYVISPKTYVNSLFEKYYQKPNVYFKFVICSQEDIEGIITLQKKYGSDHKIWLQPEFSKAEEITHLILKNSYRLNNFCLSVQIHKYLNLR